MQQRPDTSTTRRDFVKLGAAALGAGLAPSTLAAAQAGPGAAGTAELRIGLIGCGGRGTGAAVQALTTATTTGGPVRLVALADAFQDRLDAALAQLEAPENGVSELVDVPADRRFVGFDAAERLLATDVDVVLLATPPHFRPDHFAAAVDAGKHVFLEKPVAVDGYGVRTVLAAGERARARGLSVVAGLQRRHQAGYLAALERVRDGAIGDIVAARCYWNMGGLWMKAREDSWSDMEWQLRNWLYFTWLSGDHIVEQHVHNLDVCNWAKGAHPVRAIGVGGRQVRTDPAYGQIFDHHGVHFEYPDGSWLFSMCRQIDGTAGKVSEHLMGTRGRCDLESSGPWTITGEGGTWEFDGEPTNPYQVEHDDLFTSIRNGDARNEAAYVAEGTLTAILGRMATYTGREITWEEALASERLGPTRYAWTSLAVPPVPTPGKA